MRGKPYPTSKLSTGPQLAIAAFASWKFRKMWVIHLFMNSMKFVIPLYLISERKTPNDAVTPQHQNKFTPKMKAKAFPHLLSNAETLLLLSLV